LSLSYFGCDQSQVQRYLTAKSLDQSRQSLLLSAFVKIPLQALILLTGVLTFTFFLFNRAPMLFNPVHDAEVRASARAGEYQALEQEFATRDSSRRDAASRLAESQAATEQNPSMVALSRAAFADADAAVRDVRTRAVALVKDVSHDEGYADVNYVFPTFILTYMPVGLVGLMIAAIISAAMSASSGEMNALATATVLDLYKRHVNPAADDARVVLVSKAATVFWGLFACAVSVFAANRGSLIEVVNIFGSLFYGSVLGVFILALGVKRANGHGAFVGMIAGIITVLVVAQTTTIVYLWYNVIGAVVVTVVGVAVSAVTGRARGA
jgi:Na+/proline symporter